MACWKINNNKDDNWSFGSQHQGSIIVNGHDVIANKKSICEDIGVVFELQNLTSVLL